MPLADHAGLFYENHDEVMRLKYLHQFLRILIVSFAGECLHLLLPFPIPASIYGLLLLFLALSLNIIKPDQIKEAGNFLVSIMAVLFVCPAVGLLDCWDAVGTNMGRVGVIILVSTALTFCVSGRVTQRLIKRKEKKGNGRVP